MPNDSAEPSSTPEELLRAARRRYFTIIAVVAIISVGAVAAGLWSTGERLRHHSWLFTSAIIALPATFLVITGLGVWHVQSRSGSTRQLLISGTRQSNRQAFANLRAGTTLTHQQRVYVQALVDVRHRRQWMSWIWAGFGIFWIVDALLSDHGHDLWRHLIFGVVAIAYTPITFLTTRTTLRQAAAQGIQPINARSASTPSQIEPREHD